MTDDEQEKPKGRKPDYFLNVFDKNTGGRVQAGAAWLWEDGSISIKIGPCVTLTGGENLSIKLFLNDQYQDYESED